ncbi:cyclic peptide export ABC transporter [Microcoleus sp. FACHB-672]|nr:cyclic peptide export ABC transporter [Microcoleus sp. FACHB-672]
MNLIRLLLQTSWPIVALAALAGIISGASAAALIALINIAITQTQLPATLIWSFAGVCLLRLTTSFASQVLLIRLSQNAIFNLRMLLSRRILATPLHQLEQIGAPRLLATLTDDIQSVANVVFNIPFICIDIAIVISCLAYLCWLSWSVFLFIVGFLLLGIFSYQLLDAKAVHYLKLARDRQDSLFKHFRTMTEGAKELKLHRERRQAFLAEDLQDTALSSQHHNVEGLTVYAILASWGRVLFFIAIGVLVFILPNLQKIETPILSGFALTTLYLAQPLEEILGILPNFSRASVALNKIDSLGLLLSTHAEEESAISLTAGSNWQRLELVGVTHAYRGEREEDSFVLGPINLTFHSGELIFIVGGNGSGKSTLAKLITGLYIPEDGEICVDNTPINNQNREWYRQQFSAIFSDFYLFDKLLGLGNPNLETQAKNYLSQLQLEHKVEIKDGVLSTTALSQGQRKRLALLTAYLEDRPIYLFDEWASDQDPVFKEIFYTQLLPELKRKGKTVLVISHDDRYFSIADRLVKLEYGKVEYDNKI